MIGCSLLAVALSCLWAGNLRAQSGGGVTPDVDALFADWKSQESPGCALIVNQDGVIAYKHGYGSADLEHGVPIAPDSAFDVASISKQFTAAAAALLARDGKLAFHDPIRKHLPEIPQYANSVTIRHLIHHQSGMPEVTDALYLTGKDYTDLVTAADVMKLLGRWRALTFSPGERFQYANINYVVLGWIVEKVSGQSLRDFTTSRIFGPLGMTSTHFAGKLGEIIRERAVGYQLDAASGEFRRQIDNHTYIGHSNLWTTVEDLAIWLNNFEDGKLGGTEFAEQMLELPPPVLGERVYPTPLGSTLIATRDFAGFTTPGAGGTVRW